MDALTDFEAHITRELAKAVSIHCEDHMMKTFFGKPPLHAPYAELRRAQTIARTEIARGQLLSPVMFEYEKVEFDPLLGPGK